MARRHYTAEKIIVKLREMEIHCNQGMTVEEAARQVDISVQTYYRWRKQ